MRFLSSKMGKEVGTFTCRYEFTLRLWLRYSREGGAPLFVTSQRPVVRIRLNQVEANDQLLQVGYLY